jgi:hypothetical protein
MKTKILQLMVCLCVSPLLAAQQAAQVFSIPVTQEPQSAMQSAGDEPLPDAASQRNLAIKNARTISIKSETAYITPSTLDRALLKQKGWEKLGLNILGNSESGDLEIQVDRLIFTHIHTYILSDRKTGIVLASGRVRAFDGVVASGPMAEQIVKALAAGRITATPVKGD